MLNPWTPHNCVVFVSCSTSHSCCLKFCPLPMVYVFYFTTSWWARQSYTMILFPGWFSDFLGSLGAWSNCFPAGSNLLPTCLPLGSHLSPFASRLSKKMIRFYYDSRSELRASHFSPAETIRCLESMLLILGWLSWTMNHQYASGPGALKSHQIWGQRGLDLGLSSFHWVWVNSPHPTWTMAGLYHKSSISCTSVLMEIVGHCAC